MSETYYEILGVSPGATPDELKRAYRKKAREWHPDANPGDDEAEARFKELGKAWEVLKNPDLRSQYDALGHDAFEARISGAGGGDPFGGLGDLFEAFFGGRGGSPFGGGGRSGPPRGQNLEVGLELDFEAAVFGVHEEVEVRTAVACDSCAGSGAKDGTGISTCGTCGGAGQVREVRQSILGQMVTTGACGRCGGMGQVIEHPCPACAGEGRTLTTKTYPVDIPAGVDNGSTLRMTGKGAIGPRGGPAGDLYVHIRVRPHERFRRDGADLVDELSIGVAQAVLGAHLPYETLDGDEDLVIPPGTQHGRVFRLRGRGVPYLEARGRGDLLVQVAVDIPARLSEREDELFRELAELRGEEVAPADSGFFSKIRSAFK